MNDISLIKPQLGLDGLTRRSEDVADSLGRSTPEEAGHQMEALFATMLVKELRSALPGKSFFGTGPGADTYNGWLDEHLGEVLASDGALDLAGRVKTALAARVADKEAIEQETR